MAQIIPVSTVPQKISGTASKPYLISNDPTSASTIYLGQNSSVSINNYGIKLTPGSSLTWTEISSEVWAVVASNTASVTVIYEATGQVSGQTTTLSSVFPALLQTLTIPFAADGVGTAVNTFIQNQTIQTYSAIRIQISVNYTTAETVGIIGGTSGLDNGAYIRFSGIQSVSTLTNSLTAYGRTNSCLWTFGASGSTVGLSPAIQTYDFPVVNTFITSSWITTSTGSSASTAVGSITVRVYGLYNVVTPQERYQNFLNDDINSIQGKLIIGTATATNSSGYNTQAQNGAATLTLAAATTGITALSVVLQTWVATPTSGTRIAVGRFAVTSPGTLNAGNVWNITLPNSPLVLEYYQTGTGTGAFNLSVTRN
jgi:hypothetical protein